MISSVKLYEKMFLTILTVHFLSLGISEGIILRKNPSNPPRKTIQELRKELNYDDNPLARILTSNHLQNVLKNSDNEMDDGFDCFRKLPNITLKNSLICSCNVRSSSCHTLVKIHKHLGHETNAWNRINEKVLENQNAEPISKLYLINCSYDIGPKAIKMLNLNHMTELVIAGSPCLKLHPKSLHFTRSKFNVTIFKIQGPFKFPVLCPEISTLTLDSVNLLDFSTDQFVTDSVRFEGRENNISEDESVGKSLINTDIVIRNSIITPSNEPQLHIYNVNVNSITLENIKFKATPRYPFMYLSATSFVLFSNTDIEANNPKIITIKHTTTLRFERCIITNWRHSAIQARVHTVIFKDTKLQEPQRQALIGIHFLNNRTSTLRLLDVILDDPAEGTLVTGFPLVDYHNIRVERCKCDLVEYLLAGQSKTTSKLASRAVEMIAHTVNLTHKFFHALSRHKIEEELNQHILCHPRSDLSYEYNKWIHPSDDCTAKDDEIRKVADSRIWIGSMVGVLGFVCLIGIIVFIVWRQKVQKKINFLSKLEIHAPKKIQSVKGIHQVYSVRTIAPLATFSSFEEHVDMREYLAPDIIRDTLSTSLRPKAANSIDSLDCESPRGSVIIHDDIDEYDEYD